MSFCFSLIPVSLSLSLPPLPPQHSSQLGSTAIGAGAEGAQAALQDAWREDLTLAEAEAPPLPFQETLIQSIRTRPGMYVGNMEDGYGLQRLFDVVLEYVVAQHLAGRCPEVFVDLSLTDSLTVMLCELRVEPKEIKALLFGEGQEFNLAPITALSKWVTFQSVPASRRRCICAP